MSGDCAIVIATHNRCGVLLETLKRLYDLPERPRIIVVDNASTDGTERACKSFGSRVTFLKMRRNVGAAARTIGAREVSTPFVAFCDDDCYWAPGSLALGAERFARHSDVAVLNGRVIVGEPGTEDPACQAMRQASPGKHAAGIPIAYFMAGACMMRTAAFLDAGGYHARYFIGAEESLLALDLAARGWMLWYCDDLIVHHKPSPVNRDAQTRRKFVMRNRLWTVFLRRSLRCALHAVAQYARLARTDAVARAALTEAIAGLPWILRERRTLPPQLERRIAAFDRALTV